MKKSSFFAASFAAASAISASSSTSTYTCKSNLQISHQDPNAMKDEQMSSSSTEKFAPKFDGLRFIETLVTAHR